MLTHSARAAAAALLVLPLAFPAEPGDGERPAELRSSQPIDEDYTSDIRKFTTDDYFSTPYVDHLPASDTVPTPKAVLGHIAGAADVLSYSGEVHAYLRAVAAATARVKVFSAGTSEEGREMVVAAVSSEENLARLEDWKEVTRRLADPRGLSEEDARGLVAEGKPFYWATGAMHSPETGSPEMLMELVYRLAVEDSPLVRNIRENVIFLTTPVLEVDGRDKRVDLQKLERAEPKQPVPRLLYWGKYVAHDNNRDGMMLGLELSKSMMRIFFEYHPQVLHDLHESVSHLYVSTGTGPYNAWIDPILVDEWQTMAYQEVSELTRLGVPGVWTHGFYDGWAPNYGFYAANGHNAIGRFYETQGAGSADTRRISASDTRDWFRPNPPLASTMWSIRNNVNLQQSGLLIALNHVAKEREKYLENFYLKSRRSVEKARTEGPAAYVLPADDPRQGQAAALLEALAAQGCEVHALAHDATVGEQHFAAGSFVVRMDQPYSRMADMLLDRAYYNTEDPRPYDDTGWTLGPLFDAPVLRVEDPAILDVYMTKVEGPARRPGSVERIADGPLSHYLLDAHGDPRLATFRFANPDLAVEAAESAFDLGGLHFGAGTYWLAAEQNPADLGERIAAAAAQYGFTFHASDRAPEVPHHTVGVPRVAVIHTWTTTQNEGWMRLALDQYGIPYDYLSVHALRDRSDLREHYDVLVMGPSSADALSLVRGLPTTGEPIPWKASELAPNLGKQDSTDDMRGGIELEGVLHLRDFLHAGGTFVALQNTCCLPTHFGLGDVSIVETEDLQVNGSVLDAEFSDDTSPLRYGYGDHLGVYFSRGPVLRAGGGGGRGFGRGNTASGSAEGRLLAGTARPTGRGTVSDPDRVQGRSPKLGEATESERGSAGRGRGARGTPEAGRGTRGPERGAVRTVLRFQPDHEKLLISGMLAGGDELAGTPAVVDAPVGDGHVVLFAINPTWRLETVGSYSLLFNALLHHDHLDAGTAAPSTDPAAPAIAEQAEEGDSLHD